jgi:Rrf2 family protein
LDLSCKSEYALLALLELAQQYQEHRILQIKEIAAHQSIPDRYLEQLLATLRRAGLVRSQRGARGGYQLARPPWTITLHEVIQAIEGEDLNRSNRRSPELDPTPELETLRDAWQKAQAAAITVLQNTTLQDLYERLLQRERAGIMYYI